jgi:ketosteroid isomerase-like protein
VEHRSRPLFQHPLRGTHPDRAGDKVAAYLRAFFKKRSNERVVQFDMAAFYTLRQGRIAQIREIIDSFDLVQQVLEIDLSAVLAERGADKA